MVTTVYLQYNRLDKKPKGILKYNEIVTAGNNNNNNTG